MKAQELLDNLEKLKKYAKTLGFSKAKLSVYSAIECCHFEEVEDYVDGVLAEDRREDDLDITLELGDVKIAVWADYHNTKWEVVE